MSHLSPYSENDLNILPLLPDFGMTPITTAEVARKVQAAFPGDTAQRSSVPSWTTACIMSRVVSFGSTPALLQWTEQGTKRQKMTGGDGL